MDKKLTITAIIMLILICITAGGVQATYQSSPNASAVSTTTATWLPNVRKMEASGNVIGLTESLASASTLLPNGSNNIDVHMQRNTEYGAMLILAVSDYGKQGNGTEDSDHINNSTYGLPTSTGNRSGLYNVGNTYEAVAAGEPSQTSYMSPSLYYANARYYDNYNHSSVVSKAGDAINIYTWQGGVGTWLYYARASSTTRYFLTRMAFSYNSIRNSGTGYSRACIVNGAGF